MFETILLICLYALVVFHILITLGVIAGGLLAITGGFKRLPKLGRIYGTVAVLVALSYVLTGACILTTLERHLRQTYLPETAFSNGFVAHYLSFIGIYISDLMAFWIMTSAIVLGVLGFGIHHWPWKK
jgi:uncharacterized protein DUF2784